MHEDHDLEDGVQVEVDQLDLVVMKEVVDEVTDGKAKSSLEEGGLHHDFICIGCRDVLVLRWLSLEDGSEWEEVALNQFVEVILIDGRGS
jgi:hypothetical protein